MKEDAWVLKERQRLEEEQEEVNKKNVLDFKKLKAAYCGPPTYETATVYLEEPCKIVENTAKQNLSHITLCKTF